MHLLRPKLMSTSHCQEMAENTRSCQQREHLDSKAVAMVQHQLYPFHFCKSYHS